MRFKSCQQILAAGQTLRLRQLPRLATPGRRPAGGTYLQLAFPRRSRYPPVMIHETPQSILRIGVARCDITPPVGIYHRMWGAATHERSAGVHRPLTATALLMGSLKIISLDHCLFGETEMQLIRATMAAVANENSSTTTSRLVRLADDPELEAALSARKDPFDHTLFTFTHTHGAGLMSLDRAYLPGGELIEPYLRDLGRKCARLLAEAAANRPEAHISYGYGRCSLATNRDFWDEERKQFVCGFNPSASADDTVLVGRITSDTGELLATFVNYACHPTTLAWENELISPDYIGAMREVIERETTTPGKSPAPCIFLQGASAELGPREGFVGDVQVADRNGRQLGYAALAAMTDLTSLPASFVYQGPKVSGATLGTWLQRTASPKRVAEMSRTQLEERIIELPYRTDRPSRDEVAAVLVEQERQKQLALAAGDDAAARDAHALIERQTRMLRRIDELPQGNYPYKIHAWRLGDAIWLGVRGELYSRLQTELRRRFAPTPIIVITLVDGWGPSYVVPQETYGQGLYQESIAVLAPGAFEKIIEACDELIQELLQPSS